MIEWNQRLIAFVQEVDRERAGDLLVKITQVKEDVNSFSVPVIDTLTRVKWYGCSSACNEEIRAQLLKSFSSSNLAARYVILKRNQDAWTVYRSSNELLTVIGTKWDVNTSFKTALDVFGFQRVQANNGR